MKKFIMCALVSTLSFAEQPVNKNIPAPGAQLVQAGAVKLKPPMIPIINTENDPLYSGVLNRSYKQLFPKPGTKRIACIIQLSDCIQNEMLLPGTEDKYALLTLVKVSFYNNEGKKTDDVFGLPTSKYANLSKSQLATSKNAACYEYLEQLKSTMCTSEELKRLQSSTPITRPTGPAKK